LSKHPSTVDTVAALDAISSGGMFLPQDTVDAVMESVSLKHVFMRIIHRFLWKCGCDNGVYTFASYWTKKGAKLEKKRKSTFEKANKKRRM